MQYAREAEKAPRFMGGEAGQLFHFKNDIRAPLYYPLLQKKLLALFPSLFRARFLARTKHREIYPENTSCARHHAIKRRHYGAKENSEE